MAGADAGITDEPNSRLRDTGHTVFLSAGDRVAVGVGTGHPEALTVVVADPADLGGGCAAVCGDAVPPGPSSTVAGRVCVGCAAVLVAAPPAAVSPRCSRSVRRAVAAWLRRCVAASGPTGRGVR